MKTTYKPRRGGAAVCGGVEVTVGFEFVDGGSEPKQLPCLSATSSIAMSPCHPFPVMPSNVPCTFLETS